MYTSSRTSLTDVQAQGDHRRIDLDQVGVSGLRYPVTVLDRQNSHQQTVATISVSVGLPHHFKGTHMSRFIELMNEVRGEITMHTMPGILRDLTSRLDAECGRLEVLFPYFLERQAPASGARGLMDYECWFHGEIRGESSEFTVGVRVPVTSLCPCSKAISDRGAHNQRGYISIEVRSTPDLDGEPHMVWIEELIEIAENSASAPVYALLKREDERHVTMQAYDNPVFVEDMVRNAAASLMDDPRVSWFKVRAVNQESIHNHDAFASLEWVRPQAQR